ncbi:MAG: hypothetical protein ACRDNW_17340 [Trebonia sp.]
MVRDLSEARRDGLALATAVACGVLIGRFVMSRRGRRPGARLSQAQLPARRERRALPGPQPGPGTRAQPGERPRSHRGPRYARSAAEAGTL